MRNAVIAGALAASCVGMSAHAQFNLKDIVSNAAKAAGDAAQSSACDDLEAQLRAAGWRAQDEIESSSVVQDAAEAEATLDEKRTGVMQVAASGTQTACAVSNLFGGGGSACETAGKAQEQLVDAQEAESEQTAANLGLETNLDIQEMADRFAAECRPEETE